MGFVDTLDRAQRERSFFGFPVATFFKFIDDQGPYLAAIISFYALLAIFPLLLLATTIFGIVLAGNPGLQERVLDSALGTFPIIGDALGRPEGLQGSTIATVFGVMLAVYGSLGLGQALQNALNVAWSVPRNSRPNPLYARGKTLLLLVTAGLSLLAVTVVSTIASTTDVFTEIIGGGLNALLPILTVLVVGTGLTYLFRLAATGQHSFQRAAPGGYTLAVLWQLLQLGGAAYVDRVLVNTSSMTKTFGLVLGLVGFLYIGAVMAVLAIEINVVLSRRLWPRALLTPFTDNVQLTDADRKAYALYAGMQRHKGFEKVLVRWDPGPAERAPDPPVEPDSRSRVDPDTQPTADRPSESADEPSQRSA